MLAALLLFAFQTPDIVIDDPADESLRASITQGVVEGSLRIQDFFGQPFQKPYKVEVVPNRAAFDKIFHDRWGVDHTDSWAVAAGVSDGLFILTPRVWKTQATEHDPNNAGHVRGIIWHELVHVYHGQMNPSHDFDGMDDLSWLIEGVAVYVSGQIDREHRGDDIAMLRAGKWPESLATVWTGRYRYGGAGSLVQYVDQRYGRAKLFEILRMTKQQDVLNALSTNEQGLLKDWKASVARKLPRIGLTVPGLSALRA